MLVEGNLGMAGAVEHAVNKISSSLAFSQQLSFVTVALFSSCTCGRMSSKVRVQMLPSYSKIAFLMSQAALRSSDSVFHPSRQQSSLPSGASNSYPSDTVQ